MKCILCNNPAVNYGKACVAHTAERLVSRALDEDNENPRKTVAALEVFWEFIAYEIRDNYSSDQKQILKTVILENSADFRPFCKKSRCVNLKHNGGNSRCLKHFAEKSIETGLNAHTEEDMRNCFKNLYMLQCCDVSLSQEESKTLVEKFAKFAIPEGEELVLEMTAKAVKFAAKAEVKTYYIEGNFSKKVSDRNNKKC